MVPVAIKDAAVNLTLEEWALLAPSQKKPYRDTSHRALWNRVRTFFSNSKCNWKHLVTLTRSIL
uniref:KRAB domain-containing protein n=1 Tax=Ursus maritimus TaxID=29073 RepID=A0A452V9T6_URSMA